LGWLDLNSLGTPDTRQRTNTARPVGKRGNIQGKRTDNTIRIPKIRDVS
jgi:hypothetical protein